MSTPVVRAVRGAITVPADTSEQIREGTIELLQTILERNELGHDDLVSIIFTVTHDLVSDFPAVAAREIGLANVPAAVQPGDPRRRVNAPLHPCDGPLLRAAGAPDPSRLLSPRGPPTAARSA